MAATRLWRLARILGGRSVIGSPSCEFRIGAVALEQDRVVPERNAGGLEFRRWYATKKGAVTPKPKTKKGPQAAKGKKGAQAKGGKGGAEGGGGGGVPGGTIEDFTIREPAELVEDELFMGARGVHEVTTDDINKYFHISPEDVEKYFPEGFPKGVVKEFEMSKSRFVRVRSNTLEMINRLQFSSTGKFAFYHPAVMPDNFLADKSSRRPGRKVVAAETKPEDKPEETDSEGEDEVKPEEKSEATDLTAVEAKPEMSQRQLAREKRKKEFLKAERRKRKENAMTRFKHLILDGPVGCGKSFTLAVLVQWARARGWLVFYVPRAKEWTRGGYYYLNEHTGFWDTPIQAQKALQGFMDSHGEMLEKVKCRVPDPIFLGEAAGLGRLEGPQEFTMPEGSSLRDLVERGLSVQAAASNIVVRLRQELDLVEEFPVLIAVDEFNSWFTFSEYHQFMDFRKTREIHAKELGMVNAFRKMDDFRKNFIGAFSQSTVVGKLPLELPGAPRKFRVDVSRPDEDETTAAVKFYKRQNLLHNEPQDAAIKRLFMLTNGNGSELRKLVRFM